MKKVCYLILVFTCGVMYAQDQFIVMSGRVTADENGRDLKDAHIKAFVGDELFDIDTSASNGKFGDLKLPLGFIYKIVIEKEGYISKTATVDASYDGTIIPVAEIELKFAVALIEPCELSDYEFLKTEPMVIFRLDNNGNISYDQNQIKSMVKKLRKARYSEVDLNVRDSLIQNYDRGTGLMHNGKFEEALPLLLKAKEIADCPHILQKIDECTRELKIQKAYNAHIIEGDKFFAAGDFELASSSYKSASILRPNEDYPTMQILKIEYLKILLQADKYYEDKDYKNALKLYDRAIALKPNDESFKKKHKKSRKKATQ